MVKHEEKLDSIFFSLADPTRRDILRRVTKKELSVKEIASPYRMSLAAVSKHLGILEEARLVAKRREGKRQFVSLSPGAVRDASRYLDLYRKEWADRLGRLEEFLKDN